MPAKTQEQYEAELSEYLATHPEAYIFRQDARPMVSPYNMFCRRPGDSLAYVSDRFAHEHSDRVKTYAQLEAMKGEK